MESAATHKEPAARGTSRRSWIIVALVLCALAALCFWQLPRETHPLEASEELIWELTPRMAQLSSSLKNLTLPDAQRSNLFCEQVSLLDLEPAALPTGESLSGGHVRLQPWPLQVVARQLARDTLHIWQPLLAQADFVEQAAFKLVDGQFRNEQRSDFSARTRFAATLQLLDGTRAQIRGRLALDWHRDAEGLWRICGWKTLALELATTAQPLFREALSEALPNAEARARARQSLHERHVVRSISHDPDWQPPHKAFSLSAWDRHPGVAVADINGDGHDDIYLMARWGKNQLFLAQGDGRFVERAAAWGLDIDSHTSCAVFADFDNDGDLDAVLGRTLAASLYLQQQDGVFRQSEDGPPLPGLISSVSAVDVDNDGLLDVYFSAYAASAVARFNRGAPKLDLDAHLSEGDLRQLKTLMQGSDAHIWRERPGPPNKLFLNQGGGTFAQADIPALQVFRNTFQSSWADFDNDGDSDVYLANDFAPNNLIENLGGGRFKDITASSNSADIGFGMGASWGDFDDDGHQDLYVSNMYSTAGTRLTGKLDGLDPRIPVLARGNSLLRNTGQGFEKLSGTSEGTLQVERAGWSWGSRFLDVDNDSYLDIYALSGFFSAPPEVALDGDI